MTLEDAIKHCREVAKGLRDEAMFKTLAGYKEDSRSVVECRECAFEHDQLASWLEELKERRDKDEKRRYTCASCAFFIKDDRDTMIGRCTLRDTAEFCTRASKTTGCKKYKRKEADNEYSEKAKRK